MISYLHAAQAALFLTLLIVAAGCDLKTRSLPDWVSCLTALCALLRFQWQNLCGLLLALPFLAVAMVYGDRPGMGGGDVKFIAAASLVIGYARGIAALLFAAIPLVVYWAVLKLSSKMQHRVFVREAPLIPFLAIGYATAYLVQL